MQVDVGRPPISKNLQKSGIPPYLGDHRNIANAAGSGLQEASVPAISSSASPSSCTAGTPEGGAGAISFLVGCTIDAVDQTAWQDKSAAGDTKQQRSSCNVVRVQKLRKLMFVWRDFELPSFFEAIAFTSWIRNIPDEVLCADCNPWIDPSNFQRH